MPRYEVGPLLLLHLVLALLLHDILSSLLSHPVHASGVPAPVVVMQLSHHLPLTWLSLNFTAIMTSIFH